MPERTRRPFRDHLGELGWAALLFETIMLAVGLLMIPHWGVATAMALFPGFGVVLIAVLACVAVAWGRLAAWMDRREEED